MNRTAEASPRRVLVIALRRLGDLLLATPLLRSLRSAWPGCEIDILVQDGSEAVLEGNPDVGRVLIYRREGSGLTVLRAIARRYQLAIPLQPDDRAHVLAWLAAPRRVGIVPIAGQAGWRWKRWLCAPSVEAQLHHVHVVEQYLKIADALGVPRQCAVVPPRPKGDADLATLVGPGWRESPFAVLHPVPMFPFKAWTVSNWRELISALAQRGLRCFVTGGSAEAERHEVAAIVSGSAAVDLSGQMGLPMLVPLLRAARLYVGTDTSITHLAAACGVPTLALFGPSSPVTWGPWPVDWTQSEGSPWAMRRPLQQRGNVHLIQGTHDRFDQCIPCLQEGCERHRASRSECLDRLDVARVTAVLDEVLARP